MSNTSDSRNVRQRTTFADTVDDGGETDDSGNIVHSNRTFSEEIDTNDETESQILHYIEDGYHLHNPSDGPTGLVANNHVASGSSMLSVVTSSQEQSQRLTQSQSVTTINLNDYEQRYKATWTKHFKPVTKIVTQVNEDGVVITLTILETLASSSNSSKKN